MNQQHTVMLVDDEEHILKALRRLFRKDGYELLTFTNPLEALEFLESHAVDVIISDQRMPEMTGSELLSKSRVIRPDAVRIILTGYTDLQSAEEAINNGEVWRFLLKPWNDQDLRNTVHQAAILVEMRKAQRRMSAQIRNQNAELARLNEQLTNKLEDKDKTLESYMEHFANTDKLASLGLMAGGIAHELNNPLGGILTMTQLLIEENDDNEGLLQDLREIERAVVHCRDVVKNLLSFARQGKQPRMDELSLKDVIDGVLGITGHSLAMKDIRVEVDVPETLPSIWGDMNRLQQVFINLLTNAGQAMEGGGTIKVVGAPIEDGKRIAVEVIDHGIGIPKDHLNRIFDPFFTTKEEGQGTGLGLSVSYGIIKDHHGEITVASEPGRGTQFTILFPVFNAEIKNYKEVDHGYQFS